MFTGPVSKWENAGTVIPTAVSKALNLTEITISNSVMKAIAFVSTTRAALAVAVNVNSLPEKK
jgi:hypothetical protein